LIEVNGCKSDARELDISVIQGSILGPILFLCYIIDFYTASTLFSVLLLMTQQTLGKQKKYKRIDILRKPRIKKDYELVQIQ
jgi:hypothetical protein